jgi:predicted GNAT family N-acyltransferase
MIASDTSFVVTNYADRATEIRSVRHSVFVEEQSVPIEIEYDDRDPHCRHVVAYIAGRAIGTGRIDLAKQGKIGRVCVLSEHRGNGTGTRLMSELVEEARNGGSREVWLHAQESAIPFYGKLGYEPEGPVFVEAGIPHRKMRKKL